MQFIEERFQQRKRSPRVTIGIGQRATARQSRTLSMFRLNLPPHLKPVSILLAFTVDPLQVKFIRCVWQSLVNAGSPTLLVLDLYPCSSCDAD